MIYLDIKKLIDEGKLEEAILLLAEELERYNNFSLNLLEKDL